MDLRTFKESTRPAAAKAGMLERNYTRAKYWLVPPTNEKRKERYAQYKDLAVFAGTALVVAYFQDSISRFLEIDADPKAMMG